LEKAGLEKEVEEKVNMVFDVPVKPLIVKAPRWMRQLRVAIGSTIERHWDIKKFDYYMIDTYGDKQLGIVFYGDDFSARKLKRLIKKKHNVDVVEEFGYNSRYGRMPKMFIFHCRIGDNTGN
jgi:hypothetical protein